MRRRLASLLVATLAAASPARAQEARLSPIAVDTVAAIDESVDQHGNETTGVMFDSVVSASLSHGFEFVVRPWVQRMATGEWNRQIWVATLRYERSGPVGVRIDGGLIPSPVGYANMLLRPHLNPTIAPPMTMFVPLPAVETRGPRANLLGALYPYGVTATVSGRRWDARAAVMDTSPLRSRRVFAQANPPRFVNVVAGGGITPFTGFRVGASVTRGGWQRAGESTAITADRDATVVTIESEYSVGYTKVAGEWTRDALETGAGKTWAAGWFVQGQQTLTPRWFAAARVERISAPALVAASGTFNRLHYSGAEEVIGYRLTPEITIRAGHRLRDAFGDAGVVHAATVSVVWWKRWM